jgi:hypothetical protein
MPNLFYLYIRKMWDDLPSYIFFAILIGSTFFI